MYTLWGILVGEFMIRLDFTCGNHTSEIECSRDNIPDAIICPACDEKSVRDWSGMSIRSKTYVGTGGGRDMIQSHNEDIIEIHNDWIPYKSAL
jgi:hypothetical protein